MPDHASHDNVKDGFPEYGPKDLPKVNDMRRAKTQPDFHGIPILHDADVLYVTASQNGNKPGSCYTCIFKNKKDQTCALIGPDVLVSTVIKESIEYWPCCGQQEYGEPNTGQPNRYSENDPGTLGLIWINAPEKGQEYGGSNCGGCDGGDDCDHYEVKSGEKWDNPTGFCRVLRHSVSCGDDCSAWWDDDILNWQEAQTLLKNGDSEQSKKKLAKSIIGNEED